MPQKQRFISFGGFRFQVLSRRWLLAVTLLLALLASPALQAQEDPSPLKQGADAYRREDYDLAIACFTEAIRLNPGSSVAYADRGAAYEKKKDADKAIADCDQAIQIDPNSADAYSNRGNAYADQGDYDKAIADQDKAIALNPKFAMAYNNRGNYYLSKNNYPSAIADFTAALQIDPELLQAYGNRSKAYSAQGETALAIADLSQAIRIVPKSAMAYNYRGKLYFANGDRERALADYAQAIGLDPRHAEAYCNRALVYQAQGDLDAALADYDQALQIDSASVIARNGRKAVLDSRKSAPAASVPASAVPQAAPASPAPQATLASSALPFKLGDDVATVKSALQIAADPQPMTSPIPSAPPQTFLHSIDRGIWAFFNPQGKVIVIRFDAPFAGSISGIKVGDRLEKVTGTLGQPIRPPWIPGDIQPYLYSFNAKSNVCFHVSSTRGVQSIFIIDSAPVVFTSVAIPAFVRQLGLATVPKETGSGVFISADGLILTAAHVVANAARCEVVVGSQRYPASVVKCDSRNDVAVIKCSGADFTPLPIASSREVRLGQSVFTIGFPNVEVQGLDPKFTEGEISSVNGSNGDPGKWQISVPIQPGNSGGSLCDDEGNLVGIVVATLNPFLLAAKGEIPQNVNYAVKSDYILPLLEDFKNLPPARVPTEGQKREDIVDSVRASTVMILVY